MLNFVSTKYTYLFKLFVKHLQKLIIWGHNKIPNFLKVDVAQTMLYDDTMTKLEINHQYTVHKPNL